MFPKNYSDQETISAFCFNDLYNDEILSHCAVSLALCLERKDAYASDFFYIFLKPYI